MLKKDLVQDVLDKLTKYDVPIFNSKKIDEHETLFFNSDMLIFVDEKDKSISIAFQATMKPHEAAQYTLIISQIKNATIILMESFIYTKDHKFLSGEEAYKLVTKDIRDKIAQEFAAREVYTQILENVNCFEC